jgi:hypothetical protein
MTAWRQAFAEKWLVESDQSLAEQARLKRWDHLLSVFPQFSEMRILDLGGTTSFWKRAPLQPRHVTVINLKARNEPLSWLRPIGGDALRAPDLVAGSIFDLVISNSLIEHLGGHSQRLRLAEVTRSLAPRYAVQTPYRYFPIEPHWLFPGMQFLPVCARAWIAPRWPLGHTSGWSAEDARDEVMFTELLTRTEMRAYFPDADILVEKFFGLTKSLTSIRR